jgi:hypothetical protein
MAETDMAQGDSNGTPAMGQQGADHQEQGFTPGRAGEGWLEGRQNRYNLGR